jgi:hypothetical protein
MCKSKAPNTKGMNQAAVESAQLSRDAFEWFKSEYDRTQGDRDAAQERANAVSDAQLQGMELSNASARRADQRMQSIFEPLQDRIAADAEGYDTAERRADAAASARADVDAGFSATQQATQRALARSGVAPGGAKALAMMSDVAGAQAKARAGAATGAVRNVEQQGYARRMDAAGMGQGVFGSQATMQQVVTQGGNSSVANANAGLQAQQSGAGLMQTGFNTALQGKQVAGNLYGQQAQIQASGGSDFGSMLGGVGGIMQGIGAIWGSSKKTKTKDADTSDEAALKAVTKLDNDVWTYKPGAGDGGKHVGPYAEDVRRWMGDGVAPRGKVVNMQALMGKNHQGIRALEAKLTSLKAELAELEAA